MNDGRSGEKRASKELALGTLLLVGLEGPVLLPVERELLAELSPAGIILFRKNFLQEPGDRWIGVLSRLLHDVRDAIGRERFFISVDHEGGRVHRFSAPVTHFPPAIRWGASAGDVATAMARELKALGFNLSFSPVADIHSEPANPVIGERSFGTEADVVAERVRTTVEAMSAEGILCCAKHFPGHGATTKDSHFELPALDLSLEAVRERELRPFRAAIAAGVPMVMSAHVVYPQIDAETPATFSHRILSDLLRTECGFTGVVITDDIEMKALAPRSAEERAVHALAAGADLILEGYPSGEPALVIAERMKKAIAAAMSDGALDPVRLSDSVDRIERVLATISPMTTSAKALDENRQRDHEQLASRLSGL